MKNSFQKYQCFSILGALVILTIFGFEIHASNEEDLVDSNVLISPRTSSRLASYSDLFSDISALGLDDLSIRITMGTFIKSKFGKPTLENIEEMRATFKKIREREGFNNDAAISVDSMLKYRSECLELWE